MSTELAIGLVHGENVNGLFCESLTDLLTQRLATLTDDLLPLYDVIHVHGGPQLQVGRGLLVDTFLERSTADVLLMLDSDMTFTSQTVYQMWDLFTHLPEKNGPEALILGGLAFVATAMRANQPGFIQTNLWLNDPSCSGHLVNAPDYPEDTLIEIEATGAACLMVHREVFEKLRAEIGYPGRYFYHHRLSDGSELGEDLSFCRRVRAAGYPILVHTSLKFGHVKPMIITERDYRTSEV